MADLWTALEERTRTWDALGRQRLADATWEDYVAIRFGRTGNPRALDYLYPYLNHADKETRLRALAAAARVFEGRGPAALDRLDYFTQNPRAFLRDRAVQVVGAAVTGSPSEVVLQVLAPYLNSPDHFIRKQALIALGRATEGQADSRVLAEIRRVGEQPGPRKDEMQLAAARAFAGQPTEEVWKLVAAAQPVEDIDRDNAYATAVLVRGAGEEWYQRACTEVFAPRLHATPETGWKQGFIGRNGIDALCYAGARRGMEPLEQMLHLRGTRVTGHALLKQAPELFVGAPLEANRGALIELLRTGDVPAQRIAAVCLGRLVLGAEDGAALEALRELCDARNKGVQAAALTGLGMAAVSSCDEGLRQLQRERWDDPETAVAAMRSMGMVFLGSGRADVLEEIRERAQQLRTAPVTSRPHSKPLATCYRAAGLVYLGTGTQEPVEFLLDVLALPERRADEYRWAAARGLVMTEFPQSALGWPYILAS